MSQHQETSHPSRVANRLLRDALVRASARHPEPETYEPVKTIPEKHWKLRLWILETGFLPR